VAKVVKTHGDNTSFKSPVPKPLTITSSRPPSTKKSTYGASASNQQPIDQQADGKKEVDNKEVSIDPNNPDKKLQISTTLKAK
jgi:hypothetical protein